MPLIFQPNWYVLYSIRVSFSRLKSNVLSDAANEKQSMIRELLPCGGRLRYNLEGLVVGLADVILRAA